MGLFEKDQDRQPVAGPFEAEFKLFWQTYPSRGSAGDPRKPAFQAFIKARRAGHQMGTIMAGLMRDKDAWSAHGRINTDKIPMAATWLNQARWDAKVGQDAPPGTLPRPGVRELSFDQAKQIKTWSALRDALARCGITMQPADAQRRLDFCHRNGINPILLQG